MTDTAAPSATQPTPGLIDHPSVLAKKIQEWKGLGYHVLSPAIVISTFAPGYGVNASLVLLDFRVDTSGRGTDVYFDKNQMRGEGRNDRDDDERALGKIALMKIAAAAGVSWVAPYGRVDPFTIQNLWIYNVTGVYLAYDGTPQVIKGEKEIDYRDGSAQIGEWSREAWTDLLRQNAKLPQGAKAQTTINGWSDKRVRNARMNGAERAETGALERAIRTLGIKHTYTIGELKKPFVALRVCPVVDMTDPAIRQQVTEGMLGGVAKLYAGRTQPALPAATSVSAREIVDVPAPEPVVRAVPPPERRAETPAAAARAAADRPQRMGPESAPEPEDQALPPGAVMIVRVEREPRQYGASHQKAGQSFTKYHVVTSDGQECVTVFQKWGEKADACWRDGIPVVIQSQPKTFRGVTEQEILNIQEAGEPRDGYEPESAEDDLPEMPL